MQKHRCKALVQIDDGRFVVLCTCAWKMDARLTANEALDAWGGHIWQVALAGLPQPTMF